MATTQQVIDAATAVLDAQATYATALAGYDAEEAAAQAVAAPELAAFNAAAQAFGDAITAARAASPTYADALAARDTAAAELAQAFEGLRQLALEVSGQSAPE